MTKNRQNQNKRMANHTYRPYVRLRVIYPLIILPQLLEYHQFWTSIYHNDFVISCTHIDLTQFSPNNADSSFIAGGLVATDLYQQQIKESIESSKKVVEKYKIILNNKGVSYFVLF